MSSRSAALCAVALISLLHFADAGMTALLLREGGYREIAPGGAWLWSTFGAAGLFGGKAAMLGAYGAIAVGSGDVPRLMRVVRAAGALLLIAGAGALLWNLGVLLG